MEESNKQEGQKTVVAFIAGLLIGGLLVWAFQSSPEDQTSNDTTPEAGTEQSASNDDENSDAGDVDDDNDEVMVNEDNDEMMEEESEVMVGEGSLAVSSAVAGNIVTLSEVSFPTNAGWIVVHDNENGTPGRSLGASRYNVADGLEPTTVELLRATEAGNAYIVVFHEENGDNVYDPSDDQPLTKDGKMISATFTAE